MKQQAAPCRRKGDNDNIRIKRYVSKYTINPALAHGMRISSVNRNRQTRDLCCGTVDVRRQAGDGRQGRSHRMGADGRSNASIPTRSPCSCVHVRCLRRATGMTSVAFVSKLAKAKGRRQNLRTDKRVEAVKAAAKSAKRI